MKRRNFIFLSALAAGAVSVPFLHCTTADPELDKKLELPQTLSQFLDEKNILAIGKKFGSSRPDEYSVKILEQLLSKNNSGKPLTSNTSLKEIYSSLAENIQKDFDSANILVLNGWVLSLTEARQCALLSLIPQQK